MNTTSDAWMTTMQDTLTDLVDAAARIEEKLDDKVDKNDIQPMVEAEVAEQLANTPATCRMEPVNWMQVMKNCVYILTVGVAAILTVYAAAKGI